jgi:hypothetical protein
MLAHQNAEAPPELVTGFEVTIVQRRRKLHQITWTISPSRCTV